MLTVQAEGAEVLTIEGMAAGGELHALQEGFMQEHGLQCGFCTPGMIVRAYRLLKENPDPTDEQIRYGLAGNLCRCTAIRTSSRRCNTRRESCAARPSRPRIP